MRRLALFLRGLRRSNSGASAVEFALIAPILVFAALMTHEVWTGSSAVLEMRRAVEAGSHYVMTGNPTVDAARTVTLTAWQNRPADGVVTVTRSCACGQTANVCTGLCPDQSPPAVYISIVATGTGRGVFMSQSLDHEQVVRVR